MTKSTVVGCGYWPSREIQPPRPDHAENLCRLIHAAVEWSGEAAPLYDQARIYLNSRSDEDLDTIRAGGVGEWFPEMLETAPLLGQIGRVWGVVRLQDAIREEASCILRRKRGERQAISGSLYGAHGQLLAIETREEMRRAG